jgi:alkylated DNA repair protein (DNA oxidative demethylase)
MSTVGVAPGAVQLRHRVSYDQQKALADECFALGRAEAGFYTPKVRGAHPMSVRMLCLGRHWNARTYAYEDVRSDVDDRPAPPLPPEWAGMAARIAADAGFTMSPDLCIVNWYSATSRMGLHQDKDESEASIAEGAPVVSVSIGDSGLFLFGGLRRKEPVVRILLESGDAFVFGGPARLRYHGISRIIPGSAPPGLGFDGRLNLTFRQF